MRKTIFDFVVIDDSKFEKDTRVIKPKFVFKIPPRDLMIRGGRLYAVFNEGTGRWIREDRGEATSFVMNTIDDSLSKVSDEYKASGASVKVDWMWDADSGSMDRFIKYVTRQMPINCFQQLNQKIFSANAVTTREDYISITLPYDIAEGDTTAFHKMFDTIFDPQELTKLMWAVGAVIYGDMDSIEKFIVLHGDQGSGKGTFLDLVEAMFKGFEAPVNFKEMCKETSGFPLEGFKNYPLVGIQFDGDLSRIEENTILNQIVSHETVEMNIKNQPKFPARFNTFLFMGSNRPVKITEAKSGIIRRLIDVKPSGRKVPPREYKSLKEQMKYEYGAIAYECLSVYKELGPNYYDNYIPVEMLAATNDFYDFMVDRYDEYLQRDATSQSEAWSAYKEYCEYSGAKQLPLRVMAAELRSYFREYQERGMLDGIRVRKLYSGFRTEKFGVKGVQDERKEDNKENTSGSSDHDQLRSGDSMVSSRDEERGSGWLIFKQQPSIFDHEYADYPAQYETEYKGNLQPEKRWDKVTTRLKDLDTSKTHYVLGPSSLIFIDFDLKNESGEKDFGLNLNAALNLPPTYAELSKSGGGIHLYYIYTGDVSKLKSTMAKDIEIKVCPEGKKSAIRRMLTLCNDLAIATISSGLPLKGDRKKVVNWEGIKDEQHLRNIINKCLRKEGSFGPNTTPNVQEIKKALDNAYESGVHYDVTDLKKAVLIFASKSSNQKDYCLEMVKEMRFCSEEAAPPGEEEDETRPIVLDIEVYPPDELDSGDPDHNEGLFLVCWKYLNSPYESIVAMVNPAPWEVEQLFHYKIIGYNIREYDAPMLKGRAMGDGNSRSYDRSYHMIQLNDRSAKPRGSEDIAWVDVYEIWKAAGMGMSLKKIEIMLMNLAEKKDEELLAMGMNSDQMKGIKLFRTIGRHEEMSIPWDKPAPKELWPKIIEYCKNDVVATEAAYWYGQAYLNSRRTQVAMVQSLHPECSARLIDTANTLSKRIIFGDEKNPQNEFNYRNLAEPVGSDRYEEYRQKFGEDYVFRVWNAEGLPEYRNYIPGEKLPDGWSILPFFPGYTYNPFAKKAEQSYFMGDYGGEGGRTYSEPGMYTNVWDGDIASQYPHSIMAEVLFGPRYTKIFADMVKARIAVKHKDFDAAGQMLNGALKPYLNAESSKDLSQALKIVINSVYGLTSASFVNEFRDPRNIDNIVAKRGNLFMMVLKDQIQKRGYQVCHIKTDSIKIPNADKYIQDFVVSFGHEYGYEFETEAYFDKFVLLNDAAYVGHEKNSERWITKAKEFLEPYVIKKLFTKEAVSFDELVQTFSVASDSALYLDINEDLPDVSGLEKEAASLTRNIGKEKVMKGYSSVDEMQGRLVELMEKDIPGGHNLRFVGRVGSFLPVKPGCGGGVLYRVKDGKNYAATGSSGYRWLESERVRLMDPSVIDMSFYEELADQAKADISKYCDFDWFVNAKVSDRPVKDGPLIGVDVVPEDFMNIPVPSGDEIPFEELPFN